MVTSEIYHELLESETPEKEQIEGQEEGLDVDREMLLGDSFGSERAKDGWVDAVDRILEEESWSRSQQHRRRNFEYASIQNEAYYGGP